MKRFGKEYLAADRGKGVPGDFCLQGQMSRWEVRKLRLRLSVAILYFCLIILEIQFQYYVYNL